MVVGVNTDANVVIQQGDDDTIVVPIKDIDNPGVDFIQDLSAYTFAYSLTDRKAGGTVVLDENDVSVTTDQALNVASEELDDTGVGDTDDVVLIAFDGADTAGLDNNIYWHELEATDGSGTTQTVFRGRVTVETTTA